MNSNQENELNLNEQMIVDKVNGEGVVQWDGEGLPPVGAECEVMFSTDSTPQTWFPCKIEYISDCGQSGVLVTSVGSHGFNTNTNRSGYVELRPLETPEQKRERLKAVRDMFNIWDKQPKDFDRNTDPVANMIKNLAFDLYDAGYRINKEGK